MTEFLAETQMLAMEGVAAEHDIGYLPLPNVVDVVLSDILAPDHLTPTAFVFAFFDNGDIQLAVNRRRTVEVPGGHRDPPHGNRIAPVAESKLEHPAVAAVRETEEEAGVKVDSVVPVGFMRSRTSGPKPDGYKYAYPVSCQQFFAGLITAVRDFVETDECKAPIRVTHEQAEEIFNGRTLELYREARAILFPCREACEFTRALILERCIRSA